LVDSPEFKLGHVLQVARLFKGLGEEAESGEGECAEAKLDYVVKCDGIILAYAGKSLLRSTHLSLVRGRRYGVVGQNGEFPG
jgi:ABC-type molybdenum transport system ATPase subunit/photorepair protein PhrA